MTKEEFLNLEENTLLTAVINGTNRNGESIHKIKVFRLHKNDFNVYEDSVYLCGNQWNFKDLKPTEKSDIVELILQETNHHNEEIKRLFNLMEELKKWN